MVERRQYVRVLFELCFGLVLSFGLCLQAWAVDDTLTGGHADPLGAQGLDAIELIEGVNRDVDAVLLKGESFEASFTVSENSFASFTISCAANSDVDVAIVGRGRCVEEWSFGSAAGDCLHGPVPLHAGTYTFRVTSNKDASRVTGLGYSLASPAWMNLSYLESEPDNNSLPGEALTLGETVAGSLSNDSSQFTCYDADRFAFTLDEEKHVTVGFRAPGAGGIMTVALCSTDGNSLLAPVEGKRLEWMTVVPDASSPIQKADLTDATLECGNIPAGEYTLYVYGGWMSSDGGAGYWTQSFYQLRVNTEAPLPVADPVCAVLTNDGEVKKCTSTGEPVEIGWSSKERDAVEKLFVAPDVLKVSSSLTVKDEFSTYSEHGWSAFENIKFVEFLCDSQGKSAVRELENFAFKAYGFGSDIYLEQVKNLDKTQLVSIGLDAFAGQKNLRSIKLPPSLMSISSEAFEGCEALERVDGLDATRVLTIEPWTFSDCRSLANIDLPAGLTRIELLAFESCTSLNRITVPSPNCVDVSSSAFEGSSLDSVADNDARILVHRGSYSAFQRAGASKSWGGRIGILEGTKGPLTKASISDLETFRTYSGAPQTQSLTVKYGDLKLEEGVDYSLSYENNVKSGKAFVTVSGEGDYVGARTFEFYISRASISDASISIPKAVKYLGQPATPKPVIKLGGVTLKEGVDYELSYSRNDGPGTARVTVRGINSCYSSEYVRFEIVKAPNKVIAAKSSVKKTIRFKKLKKKAKTVALPKVTATFGKAKWNVAKRDKKRVLGLKSGKVKVKKGAKKGTYTIKLKAGVAETASYKAASTGIITVKITVK